MKLRYLISCFVIIGSFISSAEAQELRKLSLQYSVGLPAAGLDEYISNTSFRGARFSYKYMLVPEVGLGFDAGMQTFYKTEFGTFREGTTAITGNLYSYANAFPLLATFAYYLNPDQTFIPYADLGIGALYTRQDTEIGLFSSTADSWQFNLKPELGLIYKLNPGIGIKLSGIYYAAFENEALGSQSFGTINVGLVIEGSSR